MYFSRILLAIIGTLFIRVADCNSAPGEDLSANFPVNWCDKRYGTPTRTTGECICKASCEGPECVNQSGLSFYSYVKCPTCKCMPKEGLVSGGDSNKYDARVEEESQNYEDEQGGESMGVRSRSKQSGRAGYRSFNEEAHPDDHEQSNFGEMLEDYGSYIFAVFATLSIFSFIVMLNFAK